MAKDVSADLMQALTAKLYSTITGNDGNIQMPRNKFVTWMLPGIPFTPADFLFCSKGLIGDSAEATRDLQHQAFVLSKMFDYIPDVNNQFVDTTMQQTIFTTTQDTISSVYRDVLKYSRVLDNELSDKEKEKIKKFRDLLSVTKEVTDIITDEQKTVTEPGPMTLAYIAKMNDYIDAADEYMNLLIDAQSAKGSDQEAIRRVAAWTNKSKFIRSKMEAAYMAWVSQGYKNEYEQINAYIDQVTQKSMVLYKQDLLNKYKNGLLTSTMEGTAGDFYYTTLIPGNFATSPGWTRFSFYEGDYETHFNKNTSQWSAGGGLSFGLFSIGGRASGSKVEVNTSAKATGFSASLEFTQIPIVRPWFDPGFFSMRAWTLDKIWDLNFDKKVSDGAEKPIGRLVAYPITALFVRNVRFSLSEWDSQSQYINKQISGGGAVGWGPFFIGGSYSHGSETRNGSYHNEGGSIVIDGMQLVGFINNIIPKSPNPNPEIKPEQFVGGEE
ncbi:MAG: hypothetical protein ACC612_05430 [Methanomethylovorans sp.]|uniref:hypothetical protein n=1 Tax=Methanomethylovorans sp. TaxID=2758717 RepID=UPI0035317C14